MELLARMATHRTRNMLALVQAVARQTVETEPENFALRFAGRLDALAANEDLLLQCEQRSVDMQSLVRAHLEEYGEFAGTKIVLDGPPARLVESAVQVIGLAVHELLAHAKDNGVFSCPDGRVTISWGFETVNGDECFVMNWSENGGGTEEAEERANAAPPAGHDRRVLVAVPKIGLRANVQFDGHLGGVNWRLVCPAARAVERRRRTRPRTLAARRR